MIKCVPTLNLYLKKSDYFCPCCGVLIDSVKGSKKQIIKHASVNKSYCEIIFHKRIFRCAFCRKTVSESLGDFITSRGVSLYLELAIMDELISLNKTYKSIADKYHVSDTFVADVFDKRVSCSTKTLPPILSIDEIYAKRLTKTKYCCVLFDYLNNIVVDVLYSRRQDLLSNYLVDKSKKERDKVTHVITDMHKTYREIARSYLKNAIIVVDSFHVIKNLNDAFDRTRIAVMKRFENVKNDTFEYYLLKNFNWMLKMRMDDVEKDSYYLKKWDMCLTKYQIVEYMLRIDEVLKDSYYIKEDYLAFNQYYKIENNDDLIIIRQKLESLIERLVESQSEYMYKFGHTLINWKQEIINSFYYVNDKRLSNAKIEKYNGQIKLLMAQAYGYTNFNRTKQRIMYSINKNESLLLTKRSKNFRRKTKKRGTYKKKNSFNTPL